RPPARARERERERERSPRRDRDRADGARSDRDRTDSHGEGETSRPARRDPFASSSNRAASNTHANPTTHRASAPKPAAPAPSTEPMILVHVNDRLGTRATIPCLASDPIKLFKAQVAAKIGRQPHEILLKRQGERPFKDVLTLEDYGVSNGVQLDLELDTGD
ncbi:hypothetical protein LTR39_001268, partial [Cryomyces antarcticus]